MKAEFWEIKVSDSVMDWMHGFFSKISECFIPELHLAINNKSYFITDESRYSSDFDGEDTELSTPGAILIHEIELSSSDEKLARIMADACAAHKKFKEEMFGETKLDDGPVFYT